MDTTTTTATEAAVPAGPLPIPAQPSAGTAVVNPLPLHWFQKVAAAAAVRAVRGGGRATVVAATGSGDNSVIPRGCRWGPCRARRHEDGGSSAGL
ncbi:hypothetical protein [Kitasatospora aureofaciens]|uniref:hypothetical protein n=1 Tax=Kitasatospora aureofaciens TaxID=1894 RepID=UPI00131D98C8|nr:hypothetical protein [Kitasatospora aureofaciens]